MKIHLIIEDPKTGTNCFHEVEQLESWPLKEAIEELAKEVARKTKKEPYEVLFNLSPSFCVALIDEE